MTMTLYDIIKTNPKLVTEFKYELRRSLDDYGKDAVIAFLTIFDPSDIPDFTDHYAGEFNSHRSFCEDLAESLGSIPRDAIWPVTCIDWDAAWNELQCGGDYAEHDGYYFQSNN